MDILEQWKRMKNCCDNHAYSGLMQRIICELSNLSNKLIDTKANQNTRSKNPTTPLQLAIHFSFSPLSFLPNLKTSFIWSTGINFGRLSFPLLVLSVSRFLGDDEIDLGHNNHGFKKSTCILCGSYTFKMAMGIL